jgi:hypothetical protein
LAPSCDTATPSTPTRRPRARAKPCSVCGAFTPPTPTMKPFATHHFLIVVRLGLRIQFC